jgi:cytochrome P450 family 6
MMNGQKWKDMRTKLVPTFTSGKMKAMFPLILECAVQFDEHLQKMADANITFEAKVFPKYNNQLLSTKITKFI